jgi:3-deoxy-D-manno-octulosonate 8-phosphate phosphatase (KDO 8-P phosphatase)
MLMENGLQARRMHVKDGLALQMAKKNGYKVVILSGAASEPVISRFHYLGIDDIHLGVKDKLKFMELFMAQNNYSWEETLFMGDDLPDVPVMAKVGLACCPADAATELHECCQYISHLNGGEGCVRDVIEKVLKLNQHWNYSTEVSSR